MYYHKFINFLKRHNLYNEKIFQYWENNRILFDIKDDEKRDLIGCYYQYENDYLKKISLIVPYIVDDKTVLINIHEFIHLSQLYPRLRKKYKLDIDKEILPIFYEKLYISENRTKNLIEYEKYLNEIILKNNILEYVIALEISDILLNETYKDNIYKMEKKAKKLIRKLNIHSYK